MEENSREEWARSLHQSGNTDMPWLPGSKPGKMTIGPKNLPTAAGADVHLSSFGDIIGAAMIATRYDGKWVMAGLDRAGAKKLRDDLTTWLKTGRTP